MAIKPSEVFKFLARRRKFHNNNSKESNDLRLKLKKLNPNRLNDKVDRTKIMENVSLKGISLKSRESSNNRSRMK